MKTLAQALAKTVGSRINCINSGNTRWLDNHEYKIENTLMEKLPSGSGIDNGNELDYDKSTGEKLVINSAFHTMDDNGGYDGWVDFRVVVTASLRFGFDTNIIGNFSSNKNAQAQGLKEYLHEIYDYALGNAV
jgi:hypothetical protein